MARGGVILPSKGRLKGEPWVLVAWVEHGYLSGPVLQKKKSLLCFLKGRQQGKKHVWQILQLGSVKKLKRGITIMKMWNQSLQKNFWCVCLTVLEFWHVDNHTISDGAVMKLTQFAEPSVLLPGSPGSQWRCAVHGTHIIIFCVEGLSAGFQVFSCAVQLIDYGVGVSWQVLVVLVGGLSYSITAVQYYALPQYVIPTE